MARPQRNNVDYFPLWKPNALTRIKFGTDSRDRKKAFKVFRNSSSGFISKVDVRLLILNKSNGECVKCKSTRDMEIDHIESVHSCFNREAFDFCNTYENLQVLCKKCNTSKLP